MPIEFDEHPSRASSWRDGAFVVHPDALQEDTTVWFPVGEATDGRIVWEGLLARSTGPGRARICAVPFWVPALGLDDEVETMPSGEGAPVATHVVDDGGMTTFRVRLPDSDDGRWSALMRDLEPHACWFDVRSPGFLAIAAPPTAFDAVSAYLDRREAADELAFEISHPPRETSS